MLTTNSNFTNMFHPGRGLTKKQKEALYRKERNKSKAPPWKGAAPRFRFKFDPYKKHASWLLLPHNDLNFFQKSILDVPPTTRMALIYDKSISFEEEYPEESYKYALTATKDPHTEINTSVREAYSKNQKLRWNFKRIAVAWKKKRLSFANEDDILTQEPPVKPVKIVSWQSKKVHIFEASTLLKDSTIRLLHHDMLILEPQMPRNPYTNTNLTYAQCLYAHQQFRKAGLTNWIWEAFAESSFNLKALENRFVTPMKLKILDQIMADVSSPYTHEFVMDFILGEYSHHGVLYPPSERMILKTLRTAWNSDYCQEWINLCKRFWRCQITSVDETAIHTKSYILTRRKIGWATTEPVVVTTNDDVAATALILLALNI